MATEETWDEEVERHIRERMDEQVANPIWDTPGYKKVHEWQTYATDELKDNWQSIDPKVRAMIIRALQEVADNEHWE